MKRGCRSFLNKLKFTLLEFKKLEEGMWQECVRGGGEGRRKRETPYILQSLAAPFYESRYGKCEVTSVHSNKKVLLLLLSDPNL